MIIDSHVHLLPERLAAAIRRFFNDHHPVDFAYPLDPVTVLDALHAAGVTEVWNLPYAHKAGVAEGLNTSMAELCNDELSSHPVKVVLGCTAHPDDPQQESSFRRTVVRHGARVLKLHCSVGNFAPDDQRLDWLYRDAADMHVPVVIHAGMAPTGRTAEPDLDPLGRSVRRHPNTTFVLAHMGHPSHRAALDLMHRHQNLWADITPVLDEHLPASVTEIEGVADRLLFGSDAPNTTLRVEEVDDWIGSLGLAKESSDKIRSVNARRLIDRADAWIADNS